VTKSIVHSFHIILRCFVVLRRMEANVVKSSSEDDEVEGRYSPSWKAEQEERLLPADGVADEERASLDTDDDIAPKEWSDWSSTGLQLRIPVRNVLITIFCLIFLGMLSSQIWKEVERYQKVQATPKSTFRRPTSDYILDHRWIFGVKPMKREYRWTITDEDVNPDGVYRPMILINGQFPGPMIECNEGDTLSIEVDNQSINATSFHWHGIYQNGTNWMDGTVGVTQCPIAPGSKFTYEFTVRGQSGTYWLVGCMELLASANETRYHSHHGVQAADGLFGPLIIHSPKEKEYQKIKYSTDRVLMIQDYYHDLSGDLMPGYLSNDRENAEPVPAGTLINGQNM
jgi:hypothetical protein